MIQSVSRLRRSFSFQTVAWQPWLTDNLKTEAQFIGTPDAQYYFEVTATDNVNNATTEEVGPITVKGVTKYYTQGGTRVAMRQGEEVYYLHGDHLGSTSLTTDSAGNPVSEARGDPGVCLRLEPLL